MSDTLIIEVLKNKGAYEIEIKHPKHEDRVIISYYSTKNNKQYGNSFDISGLELLQNNSDGLKHLVEYRFRNLENIA